MFPRHLLMQQQNNHIGYGFQAGDTASLPQMCDAAAGNLIIYNTVSMRHLGGSSCKPTTIRGPSSFFSIGHSENWTAFHHACSHMILEVCFFLGNSKRSFHATFPYISLSVIWNKKVSAGFERLLGDEALGLPSFLLPLQRQPSGDSVGRKARLLKDGG